MGFRRMIGRSSHDTVSIALRIGLPRSVRVHVFDSMSIEQHYERQFVCVCLQISTAVNEMNP